MALSIRKIVCTLFGCSFVTIREYPEKWRNLTRAEFMEYYGLGEEDMRNEY